MNRRQSTVTGKWHNSHNSVAKFFSRFLDSNRRAQAGTAPSNKSLLWARRKGNIVGRGTQRSSWLLGSRSAWTPADSLLVQPWTNLCVSWATISQTLITASIEVMNMKRVSVLHTHKHTLSKCGFLSPIWLHFLSPLCLPASCLSPVSVRWQTWWIPASEDSHWDPDWLIHSADTKTVLEGNSCSVVKKSFFCVRQCCSSCCLLLKLYWMLRVDWLTPYLIHAIPEKKVVVSRLFTSFLRQVLAIFASSHQSLQLARSIKDLFTVFCQKPLPYNISSDPALWLLDDVALLNRMAHYFYDEIQFPFMMNIGILPSFTFCLFQSFRQYNVYNNNNLFFNYWQL